MKMLARLLGLLAGALSIVVARPGNSYQAFIVKSTVTAQAPALTLLGTLATVLGIRHRSLVAVVSGAFSAVTAVTYIRRVTAPHDGFEQAFGPDWQRRLPRPKRYRLQRRLSLRLPNVPEPRWSRDIPFRAIPGTDRKLLADIWQPPLEVEPSGTVIVYLYGGSWHFFDKDVLTRPFFRQLAAQGHVVMDAGHRSCPEVDVVGMVGDVHRAVAWIKVNAESYGVDPERVVLMGGSSGAHIALLAAYAPDDPTLKPEDVQETDTSVMAVVSYYGIPDMYAAHDRWMAQAAAGRQSLAVTERPAPGKAEDLLNQLVFGRSLTAAQSPPAPPIGQLLRNLLGGLPSDVPDMYDLASPIQHVTTSSPPTLLFQGTHDAVVPPDSARRLYRALEASGVPVVYVEMPWTEHAFDLMCPPMANPAAKAALYDVEQFLECVASEPRQRDPLAPPANP